MRRNRSFAVTSVLVVVVLLSAVRTAAAATACESSLPFNIDAGALEPVASALLHQSGTFQQQCLRLAAATVLRVRVRVSAAVHDGRGETTIRRYDTGALRAEILVRFGDDYVELLAHEFEHVLEQVDHVRLAEEVSAKRAWLTPTGAFETDRAREAGVRARQECDALAAEAVEARRRTAPHPRHPFD
jgi:hypothetical protein